VLAAVVVLRGCGPEESEAPPPPLTAEALDAYLRAAPTLRAERHRAAAEGAAPGTWADRPGFAEALDAVGWSLDDYLRVEGQVSAARLRLEDPEIFAREFRPEDAPDAAVALVQARLDAVRAAQAPLP